MRPEDRKRHTAALLEKNGIPFIGWLPLTESDGAVKPRSIKEIGERIISLLCLAGTAYEENETIFIDFLKQHSLWESLSREEMIYLSNPTYGDQAQINATWRIEALYLLLWSVKIVRELPFPPKEADVGEFIDSLPGSDENSHEFIKSLSLRPI